MTWVDKLKKEWKTFALAVATTAVGLWDIVAGYGYDYTTVIPEKYRPFAIPAIGISFLLLRRYATDAVVEKKTETTTVSTVTVKDPEGGDGVAG